MYVQKKSLANYTTQALHAAADQAIRTARHAGTDLAIWRDGRVVLITPEEAEASRKRASRQKEAM